MAGKLRIDFRDVFAADGNALVEIYLSSHVQATMPAPIERLIIETTIVANLELAQKDPPIWFSSRQLPTIALQVPVSRVCGGTVAFPWKSSFLAPGSGEA